MNSKRTWKPKWSENQTALNEGTGNPFYELTNIPPSWDVSGVELVKLTGSARMIRVRAKKKGDAVSAVSLITGELPYESLPVSHPFWYDFSIYCRQYDEALVREIT